MNSYSEPAPEAATNCPLCEPSIERPENGWCVCEECGDLRTERASRTVPCQTVSVHQSGIRLTKSVVVDETPCFEYTVSSSHDERLEFTVLDRVSHADGESGVTEPGPTDDTLVDATWWIDPNEEVTFRREIPAKFLERTSENGSPTVDAVPRLTLPRRTQDSHTDSVAGNPPVELLGDGDTPDSTGQTVLAAIPAYNEAGTIGDVVSTAREHADAVLVVDDGSDDGTRHEAWAAGAFVVEHPSNSGYGATLQTIFAKAIEVGVDHLVVLDADGQHDATDIPRLVEAQRTEDADIVIGNRFGPEAETEMPRYRWIGLAVINALTTLGMGVVRSESRISDTQSGFRAYNQRVLRSLLDDDAIGEHMGISTGILYHAHRYDFDVEEVGSTIEYDVETASSHNPLVHGYMLLRNVLPMVERERPLLTLGIPGFMVAIFGTGMTVALLSQYAQSGTMGILEGTASLGITLVGILVCVAGVVLHTLHRFHQYS